MDLELVSGKDRKKSTGSKEEKYKRYLICFTNDFTEDNSNKTAIKFTEAFNTLARYETNIILICYDLSSTEKRNAEKFIEAHRSKTNIETSRVFFNPTPGKEVESMFGKIVNYKLD